MEKVGCDVKFLDDLTDFSCLAITLKLIEIFLARIKSDKIQTRQCFIHRNSPSEQTEVKKRKRKRKNTTYKIQVTAKSYAMRHRISSIDIIEL